MLSKLTSISGRDMKALIISMFSFWTAVYKGALKKKVQNCIKKIILKLHSKTIYEN